MSAKSEKKHFIVGLSIVLLTALVLAVTAVLAEPNFFRKKMTAETYFLASVNGLEQGTPVKYKGIPIGEVTQVALSSELYPDNEIETFNNRKSVAVVRMRLYFDRDEFAENIPQYVEKGFRAQTQIAGLTGSLFVSLDFLDPARYPANRISYDWTPKYVVIPSAPSLTNEISDNIKKFLASLDNLHLGSSVPAAMPTINALIVNFDRLAAGFTGETMNELLANADSFMKTTNSKISELDMKALHELAVQLDESAAKLNEFTDEKSTKNLVSSINQLTQKFNNMARVNQFDIRSLMNSLVRVTSDLADFTRELNDDPAMFLIRRKQAPSRLSDQASTK